MISPDCYVFDLDDTLLKGNCSYLFGKFLYKKGFLGFFSALGSLLIYSLYHFFGCISSKRTHQYIFSLCFSKINIDTIRIYVDEFLGEQFAFLLNPLLVQKLEEAKKQNRPILLLSNSPMFLVKPIAERLGIRLWKATEYSLYEDNKLNRVEKVCEGKEKLQIVQKFAQQHKISPNHIAAYTDSHYDLPLLEFVGIPTAVNPTKKLFAICKKRNWSILPAS